MVLSRICAVGSFVLCTVVSVSVAAQVDYVNFESGQVRGLALSPDGTKLFAVNTPDARLEIFDVEAAGLTHSDSIPVGVEPVAVVARNNDEVWVVNHISDSVSIIDVSLSPPAVVRTLLVGDEPTDIQFAGTGGNMAFIATAHRGQHRNDPSLGAVAGAGDPQLLTPGVPRLDLWVFDATSLGATIGGTPSAILSFFADSPRGIAVDATGNTVFVASFLSGNRTTVIQEPAVCNGFANVPCFIGPDLAPGGNPGPPDNATGTPAPETGLIVQFNGTNWVDELSRDWSPIVKFALPDHDVFAIDANTLAPSAIPEFDHIGTALFNMAVNPVTGKLYVANTEAPNLTRFEGSGDHGGSTVQGHLSETRITVIDPTTGTVDPQHLNQHIDYSRLHTDVPDLVDPNQIQHSLATPLQIVVSSDGSKIYLAAFGSSKVGVFDAPDIEDPNFEVNFDPTSESANYISVAGGGPSSLALDETNNRIYVLTRFANAVVSVELTTGTTAQTLPMHSPEPASITVGRRFLYDAVATSGNGEASCSSCHHFGDNDKLSWDLGDPDGLVTINTQPSAPVFPGPPFHPMKGPMTTQTLRGIGTHGGMHWRGDRVDGFFGTDPCTDPTGSPCNEELSFNNFIVAFEGLIGKDGILTTAQMQSFTDFALQIASRPNPVRAIDNSLTTAQQAGLNVYLTQITDGAGTCNTCHPLNPVQGFFGADSLQTAEGEPQNFKVPHLRNMYTKVGMFGMAMGAGAPFAGDQISGAGLLHDGSVDTLISFLANGPFLLSPLEVQQLSDLMLAFDSDVAPIIGQQVTRTATNGAVVDPRISLMIARSAAPFASLVLGGVVTECDLIVKGTVGGVERGWVRLASGLFADDIGGTITDANLRALSVTQGPLTYTAVPPGSGTRMAIERDGDTLLDGVETNTGTFVGPGDTGTDPAVADTDGDGFDDGAEVSAGTDPTDASSFPGSGATGLPALPPLGIAVLALLVGAGGVLARRRGVRERRARL